MGRSAGSIQAEIDALEARVVDLKQSMGSDGTTVQFAAYAAMTERLDKLYVQLDRASGAAPMFVRGVVKGFR